MPTTYAGLIEQAKAIIADHNNNGGTVDADAFIAALQEQGGRTVSALRSASFEELQECGLPKMLARQVSLEVFRATKSDGAPASDRMKPLSAKKVALLSQRELLERYDPSDSDAPVSTRLKELSRGFRCIVFHDDSSVNVVASATLLLEIRDNYPERTSFVDDTGRPRQIYRVGERPNQLAEENPLFPGHALRPDGSCDVSNRSWSGIPLELRLLLTLAVQNHELEIATTDQVHAIIDLARCDDAAQRFRLRYPRASISYDELAKLGRLPLLKVKLGTPAPAGTPRAERPFSINASNRTY